MKINPIIAIVALLFAALLFYVYRCCNADTMLSITASASATLLLVSAMAVRFDTGRNHTFLFRTVSAVLLAVFDALPAPVVIVPNAIVALIWLLCLNGALKREKTNNEN